MIAIFKARLKRNHASRHFLHCRQGVHLASQDKNYIEMQVYSDTDWNFGVEYWNGL